MTTFMLAALLSGQIDLTDRGGAENAPPPQNAQAIPIVETVGCLVEGSDKSWSLSNATEPAKAASAGFAGPAELKMAEGRGLGSLRLPLIGLIEMHPEEHKGHKVFVKGMLIKDAKGQRINVTSLTSIGESCGK